MKTAITIQVGDKIIQVVIPMELREVIRQGGVRVEAVSQGGWSQGGPEIMKLEARER